MRLRSVCWLVCLCSAVFSISGASLMAQTDDESGAAVVFNFSTPGARSLGMGGAFLGSVDDASSAYSNPAGLLQLSEPEVLVEGRAWRYSLPFATRGRANGNSTGFGVDSISTVETERAESELSGFSYAAAVYPRKNWAAAIFVHQVAQFESSLETEGIFGNNRRLRPVRSTYALDLRHAGVAFAREWENGIAAGISASRYVLDLESLTQRFRLPDFFGPPEFTSQQAVSFQTQTADSEEFGLILGLRWDRSEKLSVGMVYRSGPQFDLAVRSESGSPAVPPGQRAVFHDAEILFDLPDIYGLGVSFRPNSETTLNVDFNQVLYSQLQAETFLFFDSVGGQRVQADDYVLDDVVEVHLGAEYVFSRWKLPLALRAGVWFDPAHRVRVENSSELNEARLFEGEAQLHGTLGLGVLLGSSFQLDVAIDLSDEADTASLSLVSRF